MSLTEKEVGTLRDILDECETSARLSKWEQNFTEDLRERFVLYGAALHVSEKQWEILNRIEGKIFA